MKEGERFKCEKDGVVKGLIIKEPEKYFIEISTPSDKVESKFNVGDWVVSPNGVYWHIDAIRNGRYQASSDLGYCADWPLNTNIYHKFTIQDAKDGDILSYTDTFKRTWVFLYKYLRHSKPLCDFHTINYHGLVKSGDFYPKGSMIIDIEYITPSTTEQRDLLFQKMKEAGYEWDSEKKELRKVEQSPVDKVEPKFKVGDWVVQGKMLSQIIEIVADLHDNYFHYYTTDGVWFDDYDEVHLWTIQDAKDGDVLATDSWLYLFKYTNNKALIQFHCNCPINENPYKWCFLPNECYLDIYEDANIHPATKEQRDLLFSKMKEAGYEWDAEKKELKKIEQNPAWSEDDKNIEKISENTTVEKDMVEGEGFGYRFGDDVHYEKAFPKELLYATDEELEKYALDLAEKLKR
jgi:hypothetical protein